MVSSWGALGWGGAEKAVTAFLELIVNFRIWRATGILPRAPRPALAASAARRVVGGGGPRGSAIARQLAVARTMMTSPPSLAFGREMLAIPGPSVVPDRVLQAMHRPSPNIYEGELIELTDRILDDLKAVAGTQQHAAIYIGNGHAAWEAAIANTLSEGDLVLVLSAGTFATAWCAALTAADCVCAWFMVGYTATQPQTTDSSTSPLLPLSAATLTG